MLESDPPVPVAVSRRVRVPGGLADQRGILLYSQRAWAAARIEEDGSVTTRGGQVALPAWTEGRGRWFIRMFLMMRASHRAAWAFWDEDTRGKVRAKGQSDAGMRAIVALGVVVPLTAVASLAALVGQWLVPEAPLRELVQGTLFSSMIVGVLAFMRSSRRDSGIARLHGAEHMVAACVNAGRMPTADQVSQFSSIHPHCGTSMLALLMILGTVSHVVLGTIDTSFGVALALRLVWLPFMLILGVVLHRVIGLLSRVPIVGLLSWPGLVLQRITTEDPGPREVAIAIEAGRELLRVHEAAAASPSDTLPKGTTSRP